MSSFFCKFAKFVNESDKILSFFEKLVLSYDNENMLAFVSHESILF